MVTEFSQVLILSSLIFNIWFMSMHLILNLTFLSFLSIEVDIHPVLCFMIQFIWISFTVDLDFRFKSVEILLILSPLLLVMSLWFIESLRNPCLLSSLIFMTSTSVLKQLILNPLLLLIKFKSILLTSHQDLSHQNFSMILFLL